MSLRSWLGALVVAVFAVSACSDDSVAPPGKEAGVTDKSVTEASTPKTEASTPKTEAGVDATVQPKFASTVAFAQVEGTTQAGPTKLFNSLVQFLATAPTDPKNVPDFYEPTSNPLLYCVGYKWDTTTPPKRTTADAGKITVTGHTAVGYVDGSDTTKSGMLPATIECNRVEVAAGTGLYTYNCGLPAITALAGDWLTDTTKLTIAAAGATDIAAFSKADLGVSPKATAKAPFDLTKVDPAATVKAEWNPITGALATDVVVIDILGNLKDGSKSAEVLCIVSAADSSKVIPAGGLALLPTPTDTNPLVIQTALVAYKNAIDPSAPWGVNVESVGRGSFGLTCKVPSAGLVPCWPAP